MSELPQDVKGMGSSDASDALLSLGVAGVLKGVHSFVGSKRLLGFAKTVLIAPNGKNGMSMKDGFLQACKNSSQFTILVIATENENYSAFGGLTSFIAKESGISGVVVCGSFRDFQEIKERDLPVFSKSVSPLIPKEGQYVTSIGEPVEYKGVKINSGDLVVGDEDGVTIVPFPLLNEVLRITKQKRKDEEITKAKLQKYFDSLIK